MLHDVTPLNIKHSQ